MATSNPIPWEQLPRLAALRNRDSSGELPSVGASASPTADVNPNGSVPADQPTHPIAADDSGVADGTNGNGDGGAPYWAQPPAAPNITASFRGRIGPYQVKEATVLPGMGIAFLAEDVNQKRQVILRVIKRKRAADDPIWVAFVEGVRAAATVKSPYIASVYDVGEEQGVLYIATEFVVGETLESRLVYEGFPVLQALRIVREIALGLASAHTAGFIHYDIKPAKIWLPDANAADTSKSSILPPAVKILDFGQVEVEIDKFGALRRGHADGCHAYLAPEQARGEIGGVRADLFSLGVLLFRLVTGGPPVPDEAPMKPNMVFASERRRVPTALVDLTNRLLSPNPEGRPSNAAEVAATIRQIERELQHSRRDRRTLQVGLGTFGILLVAAALITFWQWFDRPPESAAPVPTAKAAQVDPLAPHLLTDRVGDHVKVEFHVARVERLRDGSTHIYADDPELKDEKFRLIVPFVIPKDLMKKLTDRGLLKASTKGGQSVRANGRLVRDGDTYEILVQTLNQIED